MAFSSAQAGSAPPKVLVVEDEPSLRFFISDVLANDHGLVVIEAESADEALVVLERDRDIQCMFTDVRMPGTLDGIALSRRVRREHPDIKILMTSGHLLSADAPDNIPFIAKPYDLAQVAALIEQLVTSFRPG
jgi:DNA-binding NtrC family response regulator